MKAVSKKSTAILSFIWNSPKFIREDEHFAFACSVCYGLTPKAYSQMWDWSQISMRQPVLKARNPINPALSDQRKRSVGYLIPPLAHLRYATIPLNQCKLQTYSYTAMKPHHYSSFKKYLSSITTPFSSRKERYSSTNVTFRWCSFWRMIYPTIISLSCSP